MNRGNFLDFNLGVFSEIAMAKAKSGQIDSSVLMRELQRAFTLSQGLQQVFKIARANAEQEITFADADPGTIEPPLSNNTVSSLLAMGEEISSMMAESIERTADWADERGDVTRVHCAYPTGAAGKEPS